MKTIRMLLYILTAVALLAAFLPQAAIFADPPTTSAGTGSFSAANKAPTIGTITLWDTETVPGQVTAMTPQVEYNVKFDVTDNNKLSDLTTVAVTLFYVVPTVLSSDANSGQKDVAIGNTTGFTVGHSVIIKDSAASEINVIASITPDTKLTMVNDLTHTYTTANSAVVMDVPTSGDKQKVALLTWHASGVPSTWTIDADSSTTWTIESTNCVAPVSLASKTGTWEFHFKPGKVATQATSQWFIYARATDAAPSYGDNHKDSVTMNWWGSIALSGSLTATWTGVDPGTGFSGTANKYTPVSTTYISNGAYHTTVGSSSIWSSVPNVGSATLDELGACTTAMYFALAADSTDSGAYDYLVTAAGTTVQISQGQTVEAGHGEANNTLYLKLADTFPTATYSGTITYSIVTGAGSH